MKNIQIWLLLTPFLIPALAFAQEGELELGPLYEPDPVPFTFEALGWYFLLLVSTSLILYFAYRWIRQYIKNAYRRAAVKYLENIRERFEEIQDASCLNDVFVLLKQVALKTFGRDQVAALSGESWLSFLESRCKKTTFTDYKELVSKSLYQEQSITQSEFSDIYNISKNWIRYHA